MKSQHVMSGILGEVKCAHRMHYLRTYHQLDHWMKGN